MVKRPAHTVLFIKSDLIARADFGASSKFIAMGFWEQPQRANSRLYYSIEAALRLGGKCGRTVWVIGESFWTQTLSLPASALNGLTREQIAKAIAFDVEALTGLLGADSTLGFSKAAPSDESEHLWVTQVPLASRTQIQTVIESAGGVLGGIVHPGGLPAPVEGSAAGQTWRRIEVWKDVTFCLIGRGETHRLTIINGDPAQDAWRANVSRWINANEAEHSEWLGPRGSMADQIPDDDEKQWTILPALTGEALEQWLRQWTVKLVDATGAGIPVVEPKRISRRNRWQFAAVTAIGVLVLGGCVLHGFWRTRQQARLMGQRAALSRDSAEKTQKLKELEAPQREFDGLQQKIKTLTANLQTLQSNRSQTVYHEIPDFEAQRYRVGLLLTAIADHANAGLIVDHITPEGGGDLLIEGKCLPDLSIDLFAGELGTSLQGAGWEVSPAQKKPSGIIPSGQFDLNVAELPLVRKEMGGKSEQADSSSLTRGIN